MRIPSQVERAAEPTDTREIPRRLFQTFKVPDVPPRMFAAARSWWSLNPDHEYRFFDDEACRAFVREHFGSELERCYDALPAGAFRADLWRLCVLYRLGGVYADIDMVCRRPLSRFVRASDAFVVSAGRDRSCLFNAFMGSVPGHPLLERALERAQSLILGGEELDPFTVVGPAGLGAAASSLLGEERTHFRPGDYSGDGFTFRVLRRRFERLPWLPNRAIVDGLRTAVVCKYRGYFRDLRATGSAHWYYG
jgi:hypothetical protein